MSKRIIIGLIVLLVVAGLGYFYLNQYRQSQSTPNTLPTQVTSQVTPQPSSSATNNAIDCGTDQNCFVSNFKTYTPAKWLGGTWIIKGGSIKSCEVYTEGTFPSDFKTVGMTCLLDVSDYEKTDAAKQGGVVSITSYALSKLESCQGPLKDGWQRFLEKTNPKP